VNIVTYPHPTLRYKSSPLTRVDAELRKMISQMFDLMYEAKGVGLAANQVDLPLRFFVCNPAGERGDGEEFVFINPIISRQKGSSEEEEGCLSLPGLRADIRRSASIHLQAYDLGGDEVNLDLDDFMARIVQHEVDHLEGVLFTDRLSETSKLNVRDALEEFELEFRRLQQTRQIPSDEEIVRRLAELKARYGEPNLIHSA
jgi:peptide deformylase